jgi:VWFA-related protein
VIWPVVVSRDIRIAGIRRDLNSPNVAMNSIRLTTVLLAASLFTFKASAGSALLSSDQASVLAEVRAQSLEYTSKLPDFICTQTTHRETTGRVSPAMSEDRVLSTDVIEEKLTYFHHQENYDVVAINFKRVTGVQHTQLAGAISTGEFGSLLHDIFDPNSHAVFTWDRMDKLRSRRSYIFAFQVPQEAGIRVSDQISKQEVAASYRGRIFVDADSKQVVRIITHIDLPSKFVMKLAERVVDYKPVNIAGKLYDLPFHSEVRMQDRSYTYLNNIDFKDYHKFAVESIVTYDNGAHTSQVSANPTIASSAEPNSAQVLPPAPATLNAGEPKSSPAAPTPNAPPPTPGIAASPDSPPPAAQVSPPPTSTITVSGQPPPSTDETPRSSASSAADTNYRLQVKVNVVLVPVVARDAENRAVGNLIKDDFQLFDRNKQQTITSFTVESHAIQSRPEEPAPTTPLQLTERRPANNFIVYLFDDRHLEFNDLAQVRDAAARNMDTLVPTDRAAIFTTSGLQTLDFTIDRAQLHEALLKLRPHPLGGSPVQECPDISRYMANQMLNVYDPTQFESNPPLQAATAETMACMSLPAGAAKMAQAQALEKARSVLALGEQENRNTLLSMKEIIHMIALAPGSKTLILVSPGFGLGSGMLSDATAVVEQAIRASVVISALDARGLYMVGESGKIQNSSANATATRMKADLDRDAAKDDSKVMQELAAATGGAFVHNTNDLEGGFRHLTTPAEYSYLLGFVPGNLKPDGSYHPLKVKLNKNENLTLQARSGYYAPKK